MFFLKLYFLNYNWSLESERKGKRRKEVVQKLSHVTGGKLRDTFHGVNVWIMHKPKAAVNFNYC